MDTINKKAAQLAEKLGRPAEEIAKRFAEAHARNGFRVIQPAEPIPVKRFRGTKVERTFDSRFPQTVQL